MPDLQSAFPPVTSVPKPAGAWGSSKPTSAWGSSNPAASLQAAAPSPLDQIVKNTEILSLNVPEPISESQLKPSAIVEKITCPVGEEESATQPKTSTLTASISDQAASTSII